MTHNEWNPRLEGFAYLGQAIAKMGGHKEVTITISSKNHVELKADDGFSKIFTFDKFAKAAHETFERYYDSGNY